MHNVFLQKLDDYDVEASRVMEVSKQITKYKQSQVTKDSSGSELAEDEEFMEIFKSYEGNNIQIKQFHIQQIMLSLYKLLRMVLMGNGGFNSMSLSKLKESLLLGERLYWVDYCMYVLK